MVFRDDGHLSGQALDALVRNDENFDELERLEIAEHLAFCDFCLQRYTEALAAVPLLVPERSCRETLWTRIRARAVQLAVSRYATAAAAVALALTMLWGGAGEERVLRISLPEDRPSISRQLTDLTGELNDSLRGTVSGLSDFFDGLRPGQLIEGGNKA